MLPHFLALGADPQYSQFFDIKKANSDGVILNFMPLVIALAA